MRLVRLPFRGVRFGIAVAVILLAAVGAWLWSGRDPRVQPPGKDRGTTAHRDTGDPSAGAERPHNSGAADGSNSGDLLWAADEAIDIEALVRAGVPPYRRLRIGRVNPVWLDRKHSPLFQLQDGSTIIPLRLWSDVSFAVRLQETAVLGQARHGVRGTIDGFPDSRFMFSAAEDAVAFSVYLGPDERYGGVTLPDGRVAIFEIDAAASLGCAGMLPDLPDADALAVAGARPFAVRTGAAVGFEPGSPAGTPPTAGAPPSTVATLDVLMLYTPLVSSAATPPPALVSRVDLALAEANDEFARSETRVRLRLVGLRPVAYIEETGAGSHAAALDRLRRTSDGEMDEVHALRDALGADVVCLVVQGTDPGNIGIAYVLDSLAEPERQFNDLFAFSVVQNAWLVGSSTFSHEIGHNLGCAHDREHSEFPGLFPYSYGYRFGGPAQNRYRTIMAYQPGTAVYYFSNPRLVLPEEPQYALGVARGLPFEADNAASINHAAHFVASYRPNRLDPPARGRLHNVSTRAWVGTGDDVLIGGFFVDGPGPKQLLVRVRGPFLTRFNIANALLDPEVQLVEQATKTTLATNNDWGSAPNAGAIAATGLAPQDPRESALLVTLAPGGYTAIARGVGGTTGVALVEVFEVGGGTGPRLVNLSTRGFVDTGDRVMIGGLIVHGRPGETKRLLFRALGPSLASAGVGNALFDPALRLYNQDGEMLLDNDDWDFLSEHLQAQVQALGLAPAVRRESVLLVDLPPGAYTLIVRPFENDTGVEPGVGLIEAYEITTP